MAKKITDIDELIKAQKEQVKKYRQKRKNFAGQLLLI